MIGSLFCGASPKTAIMADVIEASLVYGVTATCLVVSLVSPADSPNQEKFTPIAQALAILFGSLSIPIAIASRKSE